MKGSAGCHFGKRSYRKAFKSYLCMFISLMIAVGTMYIVPIKANAGTNWIKQPSGTKSSLNSVCYGNGRFVAVGDTGTIITSTDGAVWTSILSGTTNDLLDVATDGNGRFVAVGENGTVVFSIDNGLNWQMQNINGTLNNPTSCISYGKSVFVAVFGNYCYSAAFNSGAGTLSPWVYKGAVLFQVEDITYGNSKFWAVGDAIKYSLDGTGWADVSWQYCTLTGFLNAIVYNDATYFISVGDYGKAYMTFNNGETYDKNTGFSSYSLKGTAYGQINGKIFFACVGNNNSGGGTIITTENTTTWEDKTAEYIPAGTLPLNAVCYGNNVFVCVGDGGTILISGGVSAPPQFTSRNTVSCSENATYTNYIAAATPSNGASVTYSLCGSNDDLLFTINASSGVLTFKEAPDYENPRDFGHDNVYNVTVRAKDSLRYEDQEVIITVGDVNEAPSITSESSIRVSEGTSYVYMLKASEQDNGDTLTWSIAGGPDASLFNIQSSGSLAFNAPPDYERPADSDGDNVYNISVSVADAGGLQDNKNIEITVGNVNEAPSITSESSIRVSEGTSYVYMLKASEQDNGDTLTWSIAGGPDASLFNMQSSGSLSFNAPPDYERPADSDGDNAYNISVSVADAGGLQDNKNIEITVTDVPELPSATTGGTTAVAADGAVVNGTVNGNGSVTAVYFEFGTTTSYGAEIPATTPSGGLTSGSSTIEAEAIITGLNHDTTYHYRIKAVNAAGTVWGADQVFTTLPAGAFMAEATTSSGNPGVGEKCDVTFKVKNSLGNIDTSFSGTYNMALTGAEAAPDGTYGSFGGTVLTLAAEKTGQTIPVSFSNGIATVKLMLNKAEEQTISFRVETVKSLDTNSIKITPLPGEPDSMWLKQDIAPPAKNGGLFSTQPVIVLKDAYGNICTNNSSTVISVSKGDKGSWGLMGTVIKTSAEGIAVFNDLGVANDAILTGAWLKFSSPGLTDIASSSVTLPAPIIYAVEILSKSVTVKRGSTQLFTAVVSGEHTPSQEVVWKVDGNNKAGTAISSSGLLTVAADETASAVTITATSVVDGLKYGTVTVDIPKYLTGIAIKTLPDKAVYTQGESLELKGAAITLAYSDGSSEMLDIHSSMISGFDVSKLGKQMVTVGYQGETTGFEVEVISKTETDDSNTLPPVIIDSPETGDANLPTALVVGMGLAAAVVLILRNKKGFIK